MTKNSVDLLDLTGEIVCAFVHNNALSPAELSNFIVSVYQALDRINSGEQSPAAAAEMPDAGKPAVPISKSVTPDYIVCLEDGQRYKSLKRHLWVAYGMTPDAYRQKWGLPANYPMVALNYSARRSALATRIGLGKKNRSLASAS